MAVPAHGIRHFGTGISKDVVDDSVSVYCNDADLAFLNELNTANNYFNTFKTRNGRLGEEGGSATDAFNTVGVHSRGCGYAELDPDYAYPMVDSLDKDVTVSTVTWGRAARTGLT